MGVAVFFVLAAAVAAILIYPLLPGRAPVQEDPALTDGDIEQLVSTLRQTRGNGDLKCPSCGASYQPADRFCGRCGGSLPRTETASTGTSCPSCGAGLRANDLFCAKCGYELAVREVE